MNPSRTPSSEQGREKFSGLSKIARQVIAIPFTAAIIWCGNCQALTLSLTNELPVASISSAPNATAQGGAGNADLDPRITQGAMALLQTLTPGRSGVPSVAAARNLAGIRANPRARQQTAIAKLHQQAGDGFTIHLRAQNSTPMQIKGRLMARPAVGLAGALTGQEQDEHTARVFLRENRDVLRIEDPDTEFKLAYHETDELDRRRLRFDQRYKELEVWPAELSVHLDANGNVALLDGAFVPTPTGIELTPRITAAQATAKARATVEGGARGTATEPALIIFGPLDKPPRLAWKLELSIGLAQDWLIVVDALDGSVLKSVNRCMDVNVPGSGVDLLGIKRDLNVWLTNKVFRLIDTTKPMFDFASDPVKDLRGVIYVEDFLSRSQPFFISSKPDAWEFPEAVSAAFNLSEVFDYYWERHNRNSYDNHGSSLHAVVGITNYSNASWDPVHKLMRFGDGDRWAGSLDVVGHEVTHGVTASVGSKGVLDYENQPGALNEAFSDIFGEMVEAKTFGRADWLAGSQLSRVVRNMRNPSSFVLAGTSLRYPQRMSEYRDLGKDAGGVHFNSSIISHAFYLLAEGIGNALGLEDSERIFYRCLTGHLTPQSQFIDARLGCVASAEESFGENSTQALKTAEAFDGVEIFAAPASTAPPSSEFPVVQAPDSTLFLRADSIGSYSLFRKEDQQGDGVSGKLLATRLSLSRPSVQGDGSTALYETVLKNLCRISTLRATNQCWDFRGAVHSVAVTPDGTRGAFVFQDPTTGQKTNLIYTFSVGQTNLTPYKLVTPVLDGPPTDNVLYADTLTFSPDGSLLIYDAVTTLRLPSGVTQQASAVYGIDPDSDTIRVLISPTTAVDINNPTFAQTSSRFIAFEARFSTGDSGIYVMDLNKGAFKQIGLSRGGPGFPSFTGDDSGIVFASADSRVASGRSLWLQPLKSDRLTTNGPPRLWLSNASLGVIYRRGVYTAPNHLPAVSITSPKIDATYQSFNQVIITASASDSEGQISQVEFFADDTFIGTASSEPFTFVWTDAPPGDHRLYARVTDDRGGVTTSEPVLISVLPETPLGLARADGQLILSWSGSSSASELQETATLANPAVWSPVAQMPTLTNGRFSISVPITGGSRFYRLVCLNANCVVSAFGEGDTVYVAEPPLGSDAKVGTRAQPVATLEKGIQLASLFAPKKRVLVARGTYFPVGPLEMVSGVSLYGSFDAAANWTRTETNTSTIYGATSAVLATNLTEDTHLEGFNIFASPGRTNGESSYCIRVVGGTGTLVIRSNRIAAAEGAPGANGGHGGNGAPGGAGTGGNGGGTGGSSPCGQNGGSGGDGGSDGTDGGSGKGGMGWNGIQKTSGAPGVGGRARFIPETGGVGEDGANGNAGANGAPALALGIIVGDQYVSARGVGGTRGSDGQGGGGGGGGGSDSLLPFSSGGKGGGGGGGGCHSEPGGAGVGGGGSFAVFIVGGHASIEANGLETSLGGRGGNGGNGGLGGAGGANGKGGSVGASSGGNGGRGGSGGAAGSGSGAPGGPSFGIFYTSDSSVTIGANTFSLGPGGAGGIGGKNAVLGQAPNGLTGISTNILAP